MGSAAPPNRLSPWFDLRSSDRLTQPVLALPRLGSSMPRFVAAPFGPAVLRHCPTLPPACKTAPRVTSDRLLPRKPDQSPDRKRPANGNAPARHQTETCLASETQHAPKVQAEFQVGTEHDSFALAAGVTDGNRADAIADAHLPHLWRRGYSLITPTTALAKWCGLNGTQPS